MIAWSRRAAWPVCSALGLLLVAPSCGDQNACADDLTSSCQPLYPPTFDAVYTNTIQSSCAIGGASCHGSSPGQGGLVFADIDASYAALQPYLADDATCSTLVSRISSNDEEVQMPPGQRLSDAARCSIFLWVAAGAPR